MRIISIDPGTTNTGMAYMDERRVMCVKTLTHRKGCGVDNALLADRCRRIWEAVSDFMADKPHDMVVIEGYQPFQGNKFYSNSHQTPWLCGAIVMALEEAGEPYAIQYSRKVLNPHTRGSYSRKKDDLEMGREVFPGALMATNDHTRSAVVHGIWYLDNAEDGHG